MIQFEDLYEQLPKLTEAWTLDDVQKWLKLNSLDSLISVFSSQFTHIGTMSIDGKKMKNMTQQTISKQMTIKSRQILKILVEWVEEQRQQYDQYVKEREMAIRRSGEVLQQVKVNRQLKIQMKPALKVTLQKKAREFLIFDTIKIGRLNTNNIIIEDEAVSRIHASITKSNSSFFIRDHSKFGTFIQNTAKIELSQGLIFMLGRTQFSVKALNISRIYFDITIRVVDQHDTIQKFVGRTIVTIGSKSKDLEYLFDEDIKDQHAVIKLQDGRVLLQPKHGQTYSRLKAQSPYRIWNNRFKLGSTVLRTQLVWGCQRCQKSIAYAEQSRQECFGCQSRK